MGDSWAEVWVVEHNKVTRTSTEAEKRDSLVVILVC